MASFAEYLRPPGAWGRLELQHPGPPDVVRSVKCSYAYADAVARPDQRFFAHVPAVYPYAPTLALALAPQAYQSVTEWAAGIPTLATRSLSTTPSLSTSYTELTQIDDGLNNWGLPKALVGSGDPDEEYEATAIDESLSGGATPAQKRILLLIAVLYMALLLRRNGVVPPRYRAKPPRPPLSAMWPMLWKLR